MSPYDPASFDSYLRESTWATEGLMPRPAPGTVLAETPPFMWDSIQSHSFIVTNDEDAPFPVDLEHRTAANDRNVRAQRLVVPPRSQVSLNLSIMVRMSERYRLVAA